MEKQEEEDQPLLTPSAQSQAGGGELSISAVEQTPTLTADARKAEQWRAWLRVAFDVAGYSATASLLAIVNKWAIVVFPYPAVLTCFQYASSALMVVLGGALGILEYDPLTRSSCIGFLPAAATFYVSVWTNTQLLKRANVDTFILFRSCLPIVVAVCESIFLARPWPSGETFASLAAILLGALAFAATDSEISVSSYMWAFAYLVVITFDMVYIKSVVTHIKLSIWGLVLHNNALALLFFPPAMLLMGEHKEMIAAAAATTAAAGDAALGAASGIASFLSFSVLFPVILSCIIGCAISYFGFACRSSLSATSFTVMGVINKLLTVLINVWVWDKHAGSVGIASLVACVLAGVWYQNSVSKQPKPSGGGATGGGGGGGDGKAGPAQEQGGSDKALLKPPEGRGEKGAGGDVEDGGKT